MISDKQFLYLGGAALVGLVVIGYFGKKTVEAATDATVGAITGNNAITKDTPYANKGIVGTLAAVANNASGGNLQELGEYLGGKAFDWFGPKYEPSPDIRLTGQVIEGEYKVLQQLNSEKMQ